MRPLIDLNYAIFRSEPVYTLNDLAQIGAYNSNHDIKKELSYKNIDIVSLNVKYVKIRKYTF